MIEAPSLDLAPADRRSPEYSLTPDRPLMGHVRRTRGTYRRDLFGARGLMRRHGAPVTANGVDALADEPVVCDGKMAGRVTSGRVRHHLNASIAAGCVPAWLAEPTDGFQIEIPGVWHGAAIVPQPPIDPTGAGMRSRHGRCIRPHRPKPSVNA